MFFFNGTDFRDLLIVEKAERPVFPSVKNTTKEKLIDNGAYFISSRREPMYIKVSFSFVGNQKEINTVRRVLSTLLYTREPETLFFYDEPDIIYQAKVDGQITFNENHNYVKGTITFIVPDGVGYSKNMKDLYFYNVTSITVENHGTDFAYPVFDFRVHGNITMIGLANQWGSYQFGDAMENAPLKEVTIEAAQASSLYKTKGTATILNEDIQTSQGWAVIKQSFLYPGSDFNGSVSNITTTQLPNNTTTVTVGQGAKYWQTGEKIADWVKGKTFKFDKIKEVNQSRSKKAYRILDDEGYLGWILEQDIVGLEKNMKGIYPIFTDPTDGSSYTSLALYKSVNKNESDFDVNYKVTYKANLNEYGSMSLVVITADNQIIAGVRAETVRGDAEVDFVCYTNNLTGTREMGRIKANFTGTMSIKKRDGDCSFTMYNEWDKRTYGIKLTDNETKDMKADRVVIMCTKPKGKKFIERGYPLNIKFTGYNADVVYTSSSGSSGETEKRNIQAPRFMYSTGDHIQINMKTGNAFVNGEKELTPIAYGSKPVAISPGKEEVLITTEGDKGSFVDVYVGFREVYR
ncbi:MAG: phage tail family protein [Finegoldia sp.]|nr:phage tail family protein [Finegoldia sp.]